MAILDITPLAVGQVGITPRIVFINTNNTLNEVLATGYLNTAIQNGATFTEADMCCVSTRPSVSSTAYTVGWFEISHVGTDWSLIPTQAPGTVVLPTVANYLAHFTNVDGTLSSAAANVINAGNIQAGLSGTAGILKSFPATAAKGSLNITGVANTGNTATTVSNAAMGQASVVSIPD